MFSQMTQPLTMGLMMIIQTILTVFISGVGGSSTWFSYILFIIFLGASLASNETFPISSAMFVILLKGSVTPLPLFLLDQMIFPFKMTIEGSFPTMYQIMMSSKASLGLMYSVPSMNMTMHIIMFLLLTLIVVVKITNTFFGPLRLT